MSANSLAYDPGPALDPAASVFVSANAGAGKTTLLTSRVLNLLLHGAPASKILCLTFTNAAAAEMKGRVMSELGAWVMADEKTLVSKLTSLIGRAPDETMVKLSRSLFARVLEAPEGIRMQTIHGFCQSLLKRFPIEAGINPHFTVMDTRTEQELLQEARARLFSRALLHDAGLREALHAVAQRLSEPWFHDLMAAIIQHKRRFYTLFASHDGVENAAGEIMALLGIGQDVTSQSLAEEHFTHSADMLAQLARAAAELLAADGGDSDQKTGQGLIGWLQNRAAVEDYVDVFLTLEHAPRKTLFTKKAKLDPALAEVLKQEQERVFRFNNRRRALQVKQGTLHVLHIAEALLALYNTLKTTRGLMDYDDLIMTASALLKRDRIAPWVLYKLDGGIDHILVDEAQDTSPEQWAIIDAITKEFFAGQGRQLADRSLFIVGDEKQSIFSFQGADPSELGRMQGYFTQQIKASARTVRRMELTHSFRSTRQVLAAVDAVFAQPQAKEGLTFGDTALAHIATIERPGVVELWPLVEPKEDDLAAPATLLARRIAETIRDWLRDGVCDAGDIMILVRNRTTLLDRLVRALKKRGVPVAGQDRMALSDNLAVQDLIAIGQCLLLPEDDLTLASALKSPVFNLGDDELFGLAYGRGEASLWERLGQSKNEMCRRAHALLVELRRRADFISPYEIYSWLLDTEGARRRFTGRMGAEYTDPIDEFLGQALLYERSHTPSLQGFLHWLASSDSEIKRDMEQSHGEVRIMTVHGAKGLQAPIVILPDTTVPPTLTDMLLWHKETGRTLPFWPASKAGDDPLTATLRRQQTEAMYAEYRRLLYVALTRAADRLYICGATGKDKVNDQSWYKLVQGGLANCEGVQNFAMPWGEGLRLGSAPQPSGKAAKKEVPQPRSEAQFAFLSRPAPDEPVPPQPLVPSRLSGDEFRAASPIDEKHGAHTYQRGTLIHRLLQYLPDIAPEGRPRAAEVIAAAHARTMPPDTLKQCIAEALFVITDPECAFLFAEGSLAEVPVAGCVTIGGAQVAVSGQIDRLHIGKEEIWIVDFKSNQTPPPGRLLLPYVRQMRLYQLLLQQMYPRKTVRCGLLWTISAQITFLDNALLDEVPASSYI